MRRACLVCCLLVLALPRAQRQTWAQVVQKGAPVAPRRDPVGSRRTGYLRHDPKTNRYSLRDSWDRETYDVQADAELELAPFVDRYVTLRGDSSEPSPEGPRRFHARRITALDGPRRTIEPERDVRPAAYSTEIAPAQATSPSDSSRLLAPLTPVPDDPRGPPRVVGPAQSLPVLTPMPAPAAEPIGPGSTTTDDNWLNFPNEEVALPTDRWWVRGDYLLWRMDELQTPPLVTTSPAGTPRADAGVLGEPGTRILFGGGLNDDLVSGLRAQLGFWLDPEGLRGIEGEILWFDDQETQFADRSLGDRILARPFFDAANGVDTSALIAFPALVRGDINAAATTEFYSAGLRARLNRNASGIADFAGRGIRVDLLVGYRYVHLEDAILIDENLFSLDPLNPGVFEITDSFRSENEFHGVDVGFIQQTSRGPFFLELITKVALGVNRQSVVINGSSIIDEAGLVEQFPGGILALPTNMGTFKREEFSVIPELSAKLGWHFNPRLTFTIGYALFYFSNVVRAADQISLDLNSNLFPPPAVPFAGPLRPTFAFQDTDFWAHGLSVGADYRW